MSSYNSTLALTREPRRFQLSLFEIPSSTLSRCQSYQSKIQLQKVVQNGHWLFSMWQNLPLKSGSDETAVWFCENGKMRLNPLNLTSAITIISVRRSNVLNCLIFARWFRHTLRKLNGRQTRKLILAQMLVRSQNDHI